MALPSYLVRRDNGRYHVQMRFGAAMAKLLESSHLRFSLRTGDQREARRRLVECLEWSCAFRDAPDLEAAGAVIVRSLEKAVADGPPRPDQLPGRLILEGYASDFIRRSREREFPWVAKVPGLLHLFKAFTVQNATAEGVAASGHGGQAIVVRSATPAATELATVPATIVELPRDVSPSRIEQLLASLVERLSNQVSSNVLARSGAAASAGTLPPKAANEAVPISVAIARFLASERERRGTDLSASRFGPILRFMQEFYDDASLSELTPETLKTLDNAILEIPGLKGCPLNLRRSLYGRYRLAQERGWEGLERITTTTLDLRYRICLRVFFKWAIEAKLHPGPVPRFTAKNGEILAPLPRDCLQDSEILRFVSAPLFTGCKGRAQLWTPGPYFIQNDLYWIFLILLLSGMRTGEPPQIRIDDIVRTDEVMETGEVITIHFFDMRPYDPAKGRKPLKALKHLKKPDFARVIPIHPLLVELGLLDRVEHLRSIGEDRLFPTIQPHIGAAGEVRWGKSISKVFGHARKRPNINLSRANICLYSTRQLMADWLDSLKTPQRVRNRVLGHTNNTNSADEYGGKGLMPASQALYITALETPIIQEMRQILLGALARVSEGKLTRIEPARRRST